MTSGARKYAIYRRWLQIYYSRGVQHFLIGLHTPDRMGTGYPDPARHGFAAEAEFGRGWNDTRREHEGHKLEVAIFGTALFD